ncbi:MAG TPA: glycosyltransferase [Candidatus Woesebacteria bacterium]|nr:glycosyltransferase [Candidatus Woesebacteria bacterium]
MKLPKFSVIIPVRKTNDYLKETLLKLKKQSYKNFEVLVITDKLSGSANPSEKRNLGAKKAKGEYLAFLDDDSYPHQNYFKNALKLIEKNPEFASFCGPCLTPPKDNSFQKASGLFWSSWLGSGGAGVYRNSVQKARFVDDYPTVNLIVKKSDFNLVNGFDTSFWPGEDTVLCLNLVKNLNKKILYHPSLIVYHHRRSILIPHLQQITRYAIQRGFFVKKFPQTSLKIGYFIPTLFFLYSFIFLVNKIFFNNFLLNVPLYLYTSILCFTFLIFLFKRNNLKISFLAAITIPITHLYYGILFLHGLFKKEVKFKAHDFNKKTGRYIGG